MKVLAVFIALLAMAFSSCDDFWGFDNDMLFFDLKVSGTYTLANGTVSHEQIPATIKAEYTACGREKQEYSGQFFTQNGSFNTETLFFTDLCNDFDEEIPETVTVSLRLYPEMVIDREVQNACISSMRKSAKKYIITQCGEHRFDSTNSYEVSDWKSQVINNKVVRLENLSFQFNDLTQNQISTFKSCQLNVLNSSLIPKNCDMCEFLTCNKSGGESCEYDFQCTSDTCKSGKCLGMTGDSCSRDSDCVENSCYDGKCQAKGGEDCSRNSDCISGDCHYGTCKGEIGENCDTNSECLSGQCYLGKCAGSGNCTAELGGSCSFSSDCCEGSCSLGICKGENGCFAGIGDTCSFNSDCCSGDCHFGKCAGENNCTADIGDDCSFDSDCCSGDCHFGKCAGENGCTANLGDNCTFSSDCCQGHCFGNVCKL